MVSAKNAEQIRRIEYQMLIYWVLFAVLGFFSFIEILGSSSNAEIVTRRRKTLGLLSCLFALFICIAKDVNMGVDNANYLEKFRMAEYLAFNNWYLFKEYDIGYLIINKLIHLVTNDWWVARAIIHSITYIIFFYVVYSDSRYVSLSVLILCSILMGRLFYLLRIALAMALCFLAYLLLKRGKKVAAFLVILFSCSIHISAVSAFICFPVFFKLKKPISITRYFFITIFILCFYAVASPYIFGLYRNDYTERMGTDGRTLLLVILSITLILGLLFKRLVRVQNGHLVFDFNMFCFSSVFQVLATIVSILTRVKSYFSINLIILVPNMLSSITDSKKRVTYFFALMVILGMWIAFTQKFYPYIFHKF